MKDLIYYKNNRIEALESKVSELEKIKSQLEGYIYELTDENYPSDYKRVVRKEVFGEDY
jgi:hypothetical protein